jgi:hypothetical protein
MKYHILIEFEADALPPDFTDQIAGRVYGMACVKKGEVIATITPPPVPNIGWQPIETAPEHQQILLYFPSGIKQKVLFGSIHESKVKITGLSFMEGQMPIPTLWCQIPEAPQ